MNYNLVQTTYFLIFVIIGVTLYVAAPVLYASFNDASDTYARSQMRRIQAEILFVEPYNGSLRHACSYGRVGSLVQDLIHEYGKKVVCRVDTSGSKIMVYAELRNGHFHMVDTDGVSCDSIREPIDTYLCKDTY